MVNSLKLKTFCLILNCPIFGGAYNTTPAIKIGTSIFVIVGPDHQPLLTDGVGEEGHGKLYIPSNTGNGETIISAWVQDQEMKISVNIYDDSRAITSFVNGNEWVVQKSEIIDCNFNATSYEVVSIAADSIRVLLQIKVLPEYVALGMESTLRSGMKMFLGNDRLEFTGTAHPKVENDLKPLFVYPSDGNFGRRNSSK